MIDGLQLGFWQRSQVRLVLQTEMAECGLACLAMISNYYGFDVDIGRLRREFKPSVRGATLKSLVVIADRLEFSTRAVKLPLESLHKLHMPAILHWDMNHYVVLERMQNGKALIHNPGGRSKWYSMEDISKHFTGVALELRPTDDFKPADTREKLNLSQFWGNLTGLKRAIIQTIALSVVMQVVVLAMPYYMQVSIDIVLPALDNNLLAVLAIGFALLTLINGIASLLRSFVILAAGTSLSFGIAANLARRLFRLPVEWFEKRHVGDILSRFQSIIPIQKALTEGAATVLLDGLMAVFTLIIMFIYSAKLALIAIAAFAIYLIVRLASFSLQRDAAEANIVYTAKEQSAMIETLRGIITLRLFNREAARHALWQSYLTDSTNAQVGVERVNIWQQVGNTFIFGLEFVISIWIAIGLVIEGGFSVGMVFAYIAYKTQFVTKSSSLIDQAINFRMLGLHMERLSDIVLAKEDISFDQSIDTALPLAGNIELRNLTYRYSSTDPLILDGVNLTVNEGDHIAITGPSGGGKSTLLKIVLGLVEPESGGILIDGVPLPEFGYKNYYSQIAAVLQEDKLFAGSIADNIALFDDESTQEQISASAIFASIHDDIENMPMGYATLVGDMGSSLSGGQKQRLLLARALYRKPKLLVLDEATAHLDHATESSVGNSISKLGITRIVVAHRAETIAKANIVYNLQDGKIALLSSI